MLNQSNNASKLEKGVLNGIERQNLYSKITTRCRRTIDRRDANLELLEG